MKCEELKARIQELERDKVRDEFTIEEFRRLFRLIQSLVEKECLGNFFVAELLKAVFSRVESSDVIEFSKKTLLEYVRCL